LSWTLYRIVKTDPPTRVDFLSYEALGLLARNPTPELLELWSGVSTYDGREYLRVRARRRPDLGRYIVTLLIEDGGPIRVKQTGSNRRHHDIWGTPETIMARVVAVEDV